MWILPSSAFPRQMLLGVIVLQGERNKILNPIHHLEKSPAFEGERTAPAELHDSSGPLLINASPPPSPPPLLGLGEENQPSLLHLAILMLLSFYSQILCHLHNRKF